MSEKKFSPEEVVKILRACNNTDLPVDEHCAGCPDAFPSCLDRRSDLLAADVIEELLAQVRWIPVTERLPKLIPCSADPNHGYSEAVQICTNGKKVLTAVYCDLGWIFDAGFWDACDETVTHWRPVVGNLPWAGEGV